MLIVALLLPCWMPGCAVSHSDAKTGTQTVFGLSRSAVRVSPVDAKSSYVTTTRRVPGFHFGFGPRMAAFGLGLDDDQTGWVVSNESTNLVRVPSGGLVVGGSPAGTWRLGLTRLRGIPDTRSRQVLVTGRAAVGIGLRLGGDTANELSLGATGFQQTQVAGEDVALEAHAPEATSVLPAIDRISFTPLQTSSTTPLNKQ
jgi:hypothetical protein